MEKGYKNKAMRQPVEKTDEQEFAFTEHGITVRAVNLEEAEKKLNELLKNGA